MNGQVHEDAATGEQITTDNVVVLEMPYTAGHLGQPGRPERRRGDGPYVLSAGNLITGSWLRLDRLGLVRACSTTTAKPMELDPGASVHRAAPARRTNATRLPRSDRSGTVSRTDRVRGPGHEGASEHPHGRSGIGTMTP